METLVKEYLERRFAGSHADVYTDEPAGRVMGTIVWDKWEEREQLQRQQEVWEALRDHFQAAAQNISLILAYTPHEYDTLAAH